MRTADTQGYRHNTNPARRALLVDGKHVPFAAIHSMPADNVDAFSRLRVSSPGYRFDSQLTNQIDSDLWDQKTTGDGNIAHNGQNRMAVLTAGATAGTNTAIMQSHAYAPYTPGRSQLAFITFCIPSAPPAETEVGLGYFDGNNGVYFKQTSEGSYVGIASTTEEPDSEVAQSSWNIDPMDGTGPSGITLDTTKTNIFVVQLQALYVGLVVVGFDIGGELVPVHAFEHANISEKPYIAQASLPVRYWATSTDAADTATLHAICSSVISEGGADLANIPGREFVATGELGNTASGAVVVIRPKAQLNSINQDAVTIPTSLNITVTDAPCWIEVRRNATVTAGTFEDVNAASTVEASYAGNSGTDPVVTAGTGTLIDRFYIPAAAQSRVSDSAGLTGKATLVYSHLLSTADNLAIIYNGGTASTDVFASLKWKEIR